MSALALNKHTPVDATAGTVGMTLPTGAAPGTALSVEKVDATGNTVTITGSVRGATTTLTLAYQYESLEFIADAAGSWRPIANHLPKAAVDAKVAALGTSVAATYVTYDGTNLKQAGATILIKGGGALANKTFLFGDSIMNHGGDEATSSSQGYYDRQGILFWAQVALGQRLNLIGNAGISGNTTTQMLARFATDVMAVSPRPDFLVMDGGVNDINNIALATTKANLVSMWSQAIAAGMKVFFFTLFPSPSYTTNPTSTSPVSGIADAHAFNRWVKAYAAVTPGLIVVDPWSTMIDPASATTTNPLTGLTNGDVHPTFFGAARTGRRLAEVMEPYVTGVPAVAESNVDPVNFVTNAMMNGTGGTLGTGATGSIAASWGINNTGGGSVNAVLSKVPRTASGINGEWQQILCYSGTLVQFFQQNIGPIGTKFNTGDSIQAFVEFETDSDCVDLYSFYLALENQSGAAVGRSLVWPSADGVLTGQDAWPRKGVLKTPVVTVPAGVTRLDAFVRWVTPASAATVGLTIRIGRVFIAKAGV